MPRRALVIGAGFAGLCAASRLRDAGYAVTLLERAERVGGTWRDNTYPGCACDIPSHLYSLSFAPEPGWSSRYPTQPEIQRHLEALPARLGLEEAILFGREAREARWDGAAWAVTDDTGEEHRAEVLVGATGPLVTPVIPEVPGRDAFAGPAFHTARWRHDVDLTGKRVGVIGTGASAIQVVPAIAERVEHLYVFQRTPSWILPRDDHPYSEAQRRTFREYPWRRILHRWRIYLEQEATTPGFVRFPSLLRVAEGQARRHLHAQVPDLDLRDALTPDYRAGCKRILISSDFYPAMMRPDVTLEPAGLERLTPRGGVTQGREIPLDVVVWATGFDPGAYLSPMRVVGSGEQGLEEVWADGPETFFGITTSGFPNFFMLVGPNTGLGNNSILFMIECQVEHMLQVLEEAGRRGATSAAPRPEAQARFQAEVRRRFPNTVWATGCRSWYLDEGGGNLALWPGSTAEYWWRTRRVDPQDFEFR
jgi:cation diffusion facilitator CzcD-associated flavoprotein CzcO